MDNSLVHGDVNHSAMTAAQVLILVVMDNSLVRTIQLLVLLNSLKS